MRALRATFVVTTAFVVACSNKGESLVLPDLPKGAIGVFLYLDRDASQTYSTEARSAPFR